MQALLSRFIPAADEVTRLQRGSEPEPRLFQAFCELGHYGGRTAPTGTRQGIYVITPSGKLLTSWNSRRVPEVLRRLRLALDAWEAMPDEERYPSEPLAAGARPEDRYPEDGLVLLATSRDLPRVDDARSESDWRTHAWNVDHVWFTRDEARALAASTEEGGALPDAAARRLVRLHARDNVRGQTMPFPEACVREARLSARVIAREGATRVLELNGKGHVSQTGSWHIDDRDVAAEHTRSFDGDLYGRATWDGERFVSFELAFVGQRVGATQYNERLDDPGPAPMAVVLQLAPEGDRVAPSLWYEYPR